jgi:PKHD-type hydroxylase
MNLENPYYVFEGALTPRTCNHIIRHGEEQAQQVALTGDFDSSKALTDKNDISKLYKTRNSSIVWMNDQWIYREIIPYVKKANQDAGWNFEWERSESCQFTIYREQQHYTWHQDSWNKPYDRPRSNDHGMTRKLSVTVSLADDKEYDGGDLEFDLRDRGDSASNVITSKEARTKGSIIVFPSFIWHRVAPVTRGTRYSLVIWNLGWPFK